MATSRRKSPLPPPRDPPPGEQRLSAARPAGWTIEWDDREGLCHEAYATNLRAPYLQNVTDRGATLRWRVNPLPGARDLARPLRSLRAGQPFALRVGERYLIHRPREVGVDLGWSDLPCAQWELRGPADDDGLASDAPLALWSRPAHDYLVHARRGRGIDLRWLGDTRRRDPRDWVPEGTLPDVRLRNVGRPAGDAYLAYGERRYGVNLVWSARPPRPNLALHGIRLAARAWVAPLSSPLARGRCYTTDAGEIDVSEVAWTYQYLPDVTPEEAARPGVERHWLLGLHDRPILQGELRLTGLRPGTTYHYRLECEGIDPHRPATEATATEVLRLAEDVVFRTAPSPAQRRRVRLLAMGDLGPGLYKPSYFYDVCDLLCRVARRHAPEAWIALGDLDNDTDGHPNAMDPFFWSVYNAYRGPAHPRTTSPMNGAARPTTVRAFANPRYHGLLGGLPVFPTFGNHDICLQNDGSLRFFHKAYLGGFALPGADDAWHPAARDFNAAGGGFFYSFRWGNAILLSLGLPMIKGCRVSPTLDWRRRWGRRQETALVRYLSAIRAEVARRDVWLVACFHDDNAGLPGGGAIPELMLEHGVDVALTGHRHTFEAYDLHRGGRHLRTVIVGTGGFGDPDPGDHCRRPGFLMLDVLGDTLAYWKYDTHRCLDADPADDDPYRSGTPLGRDALDWRIREHCRMTKTGFGRHRIDEDADLDTAIDY